MSAKRPTAPRPATKPSQPIDLRPYQTAAIDAIKGHWGAGLHRVVLVAPVGAGKTRLAISMIQQMLESVSLGHADCDSFFIGHRVELIEQPARVLESFGIPFGIIKAGVKPDYSQRVQLASIQTMINRAIDPSRGAGRICLVFIDEGHRTKAQTYLRIIRGLQQTYDAVYIVYLTATPYRLDGQGLGDVADALVEAATPPSLISEGFITEGTVIGRPPPAQPDKRAVGPDGDFLTAEVEKIMDQPKLVGDSVDTFKRHWEGRPGIGKCASKRSAMLRLEKFDAAGFRVAFVDGETPKRERQLTLARLAIGGEYSAHPMGLDKVLFINVFTEGFDSQSSYELLFLPEMRKILWPTSSYPPPYQPLCIVSDYSPTESMGSFIQLWGRGSRTHVNKPWLRFLSHAANEDRHCFLSQHHGFTLDHDQTQWMQALRAREAAQGVQVSGGCVSRVVCHDCGTRWLPGTVECLHCGSTDLGAIVRPVSGRLDSEGEGVLVEKSADAEQPRPPTPFELDKWFDSQFRWLRATNGQRMADGKQSMKPGVIWHKFCGVFKRKPPTDVYNRFLSTFGYSRSTSGGPPKGPGG